MISIIISAVTLWCRTTAPMPLRRVSVGLISAACGGVSGRSDMLSSRRNRRVGGRFLRVLSSRDLGRANAAKCRAQPDGRADGHQYPGDGLLAGPILAQDFVRRAPNAHRLP